MPGGHVDAGAFEYRLFAADAGGAGENWYLRSALTTVPPAAPPTPTPTPPTPTRRQPTPAPDRRRRPSRCTARRCRCSPRLPAQLRQTGAAMLGNLHQRIGDDDARGPAPAQARVGAASGGLGAARQRRHGHPSARHRQPAQRRARRRLPGRHRSVGQTATGAPASMSAKLEGQRRRERLCARRLGPGRPQRTALPLPRRLCHLCQRRGLLRRRRAAGRAPSVHGVVGRWRDGCRQGQQPTGVDRSGAGVRSFRRAGRSSRSCS